LEGCFAELFQGPGTQAHIHRTKTDDPISNWWLNVRTSLDLKRAERVAQASAPGSCKLQCPQVTAGDVISGHYETNNAR